MEENKKNKIPNVPNLRFEINGSVYNEELLMSLSDVRDGTHYSPIYVSNGYPFITSKNLNDDGTIDFENVNYISTEDYNEFSKRSKPNKGDILFGMIGTIGKPVLVNTDIEFAIKNVALIKEEKLLLNKYLIHKLLSKSILDQFNKNKDGGTQQFISLGNIRKLSIRYPSISEQLKVAQFLELVNDRITTQNKIIEKYESLIKPLFETLNSNANIEIAIKELGHYVSADSLSWNDMNDAGEPAIIYGQLFTDYKYIIDKVTSKTERRIKTKTKDNDLLFPSSTTVDSLSLIAPSSIKIPGVIIGGDMFKIELDKDKFDSDYMSFLINCSLNKKLAKYAQGSTIIHLHYEDIKLFRMKICDIEKQKEISKHMKLLLEKIAVERSVVELLQKQKKYFLDNLFI